MEVLPGAAQGQGGGGVVGLSRVGVTWAGRGAADPRIRVLPRQLVCTQSGPLCPARESSRPWPCPGFAEGLGTLNMLGCSLPLGGVQGLERGGEGAEDTVLGKGERVVCREGHGHAPTCPPDPSGPLHGAGWLLPTSRARPPRGTDPRAQTVPGGPPLPGSSPLPLPGTGHTRAPSIAAAGAVCV